MIEARGLSRRYGDFDAVRDISFAVSEGEILGILGPNGAGKTTTIRMITGFLPPSAGKVTVDGKDLFAEPSVARRQIGYLPENVALYPEMRVEEYLSYRGRLEGMKRRALDGAIEEMVDRCLLGEVRGQIIGTLSKGYRQRVGLAASILHRPRVLVLDEPTVGLDPKQIVAIRELIRELGREHTLLLSTHILPEVELLCDRVLIIDRGRIIDQGTPADLADRWRGNNAVRVQLKGEAIGVVASLRELTGVLGVEERAEGRFHVECERDRDVREEVFRLAVEKDWVLLELAAERVSLEDVFVRLTTQDVPADGAPAEAAESGAEPAAAEDEEVAS